MSHSHSDGLPACRWVWEKTRYLLSLILVALVFCSPSVTAATLKDLVDNDQLRMKLYFEPAGEIIVTQEVRLILELATTGWFAHGTRFGLPELSNAIPFQRDKSAVNSSVREGAKTWTVQRWSTSIFPQIEGHFEIPSFPVSVTVNVSPGGLMQGSLQTESVYFDATIPVQMRDKDKWFAAEEFSVEQSWNHSLEGLQPGDALQQTITFKAEKLLAMMLPDYQESSSDGLASYASMPELINHNWLGKQGSERIERIDYVIERGGRFEIPAQRFHWWNTRTSQPEITEIPAMAISVEGSLLANLLYWLKSNVTQMIAALGLVFFFLAFFALQLRWQKSQNRLRIGETRSLQRRIRKCIREQDAEALCSCLYVWLDRNDPDAAELTLRAMAERLGSSLLEEQIERVLRGAYSTQVLADNIDVTIPRKSFNVLHRIFNRFKPARVALTLDPKEL